jgi:hypothetical protein
MMALYRHLEGRKEGRTQGGNSPATEFLERALRRRSQQSTQCLDDNTFGNSASYGFRLKQALLGQWKLFDSVMFSISREPVHVLIKQREIFDAEKNKLLMLEQLSNRCIQGEQMDECQLLDFETISEEWNAGAGSVNASAVLCLEEVKAVRIICYSGRGDEQPVGTKGNTKIRKGTFGTKDLVHITLLALVIFAMIVIVHMVVESTLETPEAEGVEEETTAFEEETTAVETTAIAAPLALSDLAFAGKDEACVEGSIVTVTADDKVSDVVTQVGALLGNDDVSTSEVLEIFGGWLMVGRVCKIEASGTKDEDAAVESTPKTPEVEETAAVVVSLALSDLVFVGEDEAFVGGSIVTVAADDKVSDVVTQVGTLLGNYYVSTSEVLEIFGGNLMVGRICKIEGPGARPPFKPHH